MKWLKSSWKVGHIKGVDIQLHISMLLIAPVVFALFRPGNLQAWLRALLMMAGLLVSVLLHEIGHTLVAQHFEIEVKNITLWPLGGFTNLSRRPKKPAHNLLISSAGPVVNLILALLLGALWLIDLSTRGMAIFFQGELTYELLVFLAIMNLILVIFNLLPIYPLDGGGMLNALMEMLFGKPVADTVSIVVGIPLLLGLVLLSLFTHDYILFFFCLVLALGIGTLNRRSRRWISLGLSYLIKRTGYHHLRRDFDRAIQGYTRALEKNPEDVPSLLGRAAVYLQVGEFDLACVDLEALLEVEPEHLTALELRGEIHARKKEYEAALDIFERAKERKPDWALPYFDCGGVYLEQEHYEHALNELDQALELQADIALFFVVRSQAHYRLEHFEFARQDQMKAVRLSPQEALTMDEVNLEVYKDYLDWALDYYSWVLEKYPKQWLAYRGRADAQLVNGQFAAAIPDYDRALELAPGEAALYLHRGMAHKNLGNSAQAGDDFRSAQKLARKSHLRRQASQLLEQV